jgi:hypothetical protein
MTADRAELIEINLAETLPPWCKEDNGERLSNEEQWVEAVWIGSAEEPYEKVLLLHGPYKGRMTLTYGMRNSTYTTLRKLVEMISDVEYFMQCHNNELSRTDLDIDALLSAFNKARKAKVVVPLVRG